VLAGQERREDDHTSAPRETSLIKHGAPLTGRISVAAAIDPRIMSKRMRSLRNHPNERDPKQPAQGSCKAVSDWPEPRPVSHTRSLSFQYLLRLAAFA
jgi:hypothetical protein